MGKYVHYTQEEKNGLTGSIWKSYYCAAEKNYCRLVGKNDWAAITALPFAGTAGMITQKKKVDLPSTL